MKEKIVTLVTLETIRGKRVVIGAFEDADEARMEFKLVGNAKYDFEEINWFPRKKKRAVKNTEFEARITGFLPPKSK